MFPEEVFQERHELCEKISTLPQDYLKNNATALLRITFEFQRSLALELQIIQQVKRLDVANHVEIDNFYLNFKDYVQQRSFDLERTRCSQINRIYRTQISGLRLGSTSDQEHVKELENFLESFENADKEFTEQIEPIMDRALAVLGEINNYVKSDITDKASQLQSEFVREYETEFSRLKDVIKKLNRVGNHLIDQL